MGKPTTSFASASLPQPASARLDESGSAISLHTSSGRYRDDPEANDDDDDDDQDLPPLYTEHEEYSDTVVDPLVPPGTGPLVTPFGHDGDGATAYYLDRRLDSDPVFLADHVRRLATIPPRPWVRLRGTHRERRRRAGGDKSHLSGDDVVVDFDIRIELTHLLYSDIRRQQAWRALVTAGNLEKVRRGTVFPDRAPGFGGAPCSAGGAVEQNGVPGLDQWCHRFCASPAHLRCFSVERRIVGWDWDLLRRRLEALIRATNYRGHAVVSFPVGNARADMYSNCRTNRWRLTGWIRFVFYATLLFLFTWPWLFFRTRRWETVAAEWYVSMPTSVPGRRQYAAGVSEERWYALWAPAIQRAMLERRDGQLDQGDLERAQGQTTTGQGVVRAGVEAAMGVVNRSFGWGGDEC
ncbi:hypothetical protein XA68_18342 [Ophiocordyceps unilateralis]|uniref:Uncharacterized protein n=1 Tax=Ophiocordyceps unilateralis TaxID=268505 RepID=A0A2A9P1K9_OPHUN|nr:hypothetical protein XA68_18342 [Ophiocordyceps unilateralis]